VTPPDDGKKADQLSLKSSLRAHPRKHEDNHIHPKRSTTQNCNVSDFYRTLSKRRTFKQEATYDPLWLLPQAHWPRGIQTMGGSVFLFQSSLAELLQRTPAEKPDI
jgi:hypothetical protein